MLIIGNSLRFQFLRYFKNDFCSKVLWMSKGSKIDSMKIACHSLTLRKACQQLCKKNDNSKDHYLCKKKVLTETMNDLSDIFRYYPTQTGNNAVLNKLFKGNHTNQKESRNNTQYYTNLRGYTLKVYQTKQLILQVYDLIL